MSRIPAIAPIARYIIPPICKIWIDRVTGLENLPKDKQFIIAPNHASYIEHIMISCIVVPYLNKNYCLLQRKSILRIPIKDYGTDCGTNTSHMSKIDRSKGEEALKDNTFVP